jgi:hypothetical protein
VGISLDISIFNNYLKSRVRVIEESFGKLNCIFLSLNFIENLRKTPYDSKNTLNEEKLLMVKKN